MADPLLYLMLKPPPEVAHAIARLRQLLGIVSDYDPTRFHITLLPLGYARDLTSACLRALVRALAGLAVEPFPVVLHRLHGNALTGPGFTSELRSLQRLLPRRLLAAGLPVDRYEFHPHLSLIYGDWSLRDEPVSRLRWLADEVLLVRSDPATRSHEPLARWPLIARQEGFAF